MCRRPLCNVGCASDPFPERKSMTVVSALKEKVESSEDVSELSTTVIISSPAYNVNFTFET